MVQDKMNLEGASSSTASTPSFEGEEVSNESASSVAISPTSARITEGVAATGADQILGGFARFREGVTVRPPKERDVAQIVEQQAATVQAPTVNGVAPGEIAGVTFWVPLAQLRLAPKDDLLCSFYDPNDDPDFEPYKRALDQLGDQAPALPVLPAQRILMIGGQEQPLFLVYDQPEVYYALVALSRTRARVYFPPTQSPGAILLQALGQHGQLRRAPSVLEECLAAKRLKEVYGYTLQEIAQMMARDPEDNTPPSTTQVHYKILVATLPIAVQRLLHKRHILWSHARQIAEYCAEDAGLCELLATYIAQGGRVSVEALRQLIQRLKDSRSRLITDGQGVVQEIPNGPQMAPVGQGQQGSRGSSGGAPASPSTMVYYQRLMAAPVAQVRQVAARFQEIAVISAEKPDQHLLPEEAFRELRDWLNGRRGATPIRECEATLLGYLEAVRAELQRQGLLSKDGAAQAPIDGQARMGEGGRLHSKIGRTG